MKIYTVLIQWHVYGKRPGKYLLRTKWLEIDAPDIVSASEKATATIHGSEVSMIWPKRIWPKRFFNPF